MSESQLIAGLHSVRTALKHGAGSVLEVWIEGVRKQDRRVREVIVLARESDVKVSYINRDQMDQLTSGSNHQGVAARTQVPSSLDESALETLLSTLEVPPFLLILDGVTDPHNLGACLRSADAAGIHAVIAPKDRSVGLTPTACKVASGAAESVPFIQVTNLVRTLKWLQSDRGVWLVGTAGEAETSVYEADLKGPVGIVMGGEEKGMRRLTRESCDLLVKLPMAGVVESLNVSVAAGICIFEAVRQRASLGMTP
ncbi:23S rRNA (guanosine(2251)-2'-O)-methyltransferase RlmB [Sedimenticola selenatireducens]|uniref:23S rRNA (guanosine-2'-O-)-methyltransferase RlmB n=1 Tax=Sedimenticola selenatireducens TaxID=191960 RepID=A0A557SNP9_9GAMM|nr:23S rRNA (guanosine(2251)-2'-O)-methyltransferase RlmB [Sedimenticola selenatireducens]TVO79045.1 23S rRNA (guanosine(2251)-2'-O)-methyltransferase RlmB [Sedimenticola selenatireducens]TVT67163.1 MAG: 23S rRNA (guanosine(2251)-2'-O)-methyltransferase RlmB [Sedimenticola selenatireducens]